MKILLDPGHGGDRGSRRGFVEIPSFPYCNEGQSNYHYAITFLKPALEKRGYQVELTRQNMMDDPSLYERGQMGRGCDLLLSLHTNAGGGQAQGVEIWDSTNPKESIKPFCDKLCSALASVIGTRNRGTKYRKNSRGENYYGILRSGAAKHNIIIEHVFHDNYTDCVRYVNNLERIAEATAQTIADHFGGVQTTPIKEVPITSGNNFPIVGPATATLGQVEAWAKSKNNNAEFISLAKIYFKVFPEVGLNPVLGFAQMAHETGFLYKVKSAAGINASYHNPCGLKITAGGGDYQASAHKKFANWTEGITAQRDHLALYAGVPSYPRQGSPDPRHFQFLFGKAKTTAELSGKWAPSKTYGDMVVNMMKQIAATKETGNFQPSPTPPQTPKTINIVIGNTMRTVAGENISGTTYIYVNGQKIALRSLFEAMGFKVEWDSVRKAVVIK